MVKGQPRPGSIADKLGGRLRRAASAQRDIHKEIARVQDQIERENLTQREAIDGMRELMTVLLETNKAIEAASYMLKESVEVTDAQADQLAQDATLMTNIAVFMRSDPVLVSQVMETADHGTLLAAFRMLSEPERKKVKEALSGGEAKE